MPPLYAAEMTPFDPLVGEFRVHYAGFFDPGFGHSPGRRRAAAARCWKCAATKCPSSSKHGQIVGRLVYEHMHERPRGALRLRPRLQLSGAGPEAVEAFSDLMPDGAVLTAAAICWKSQAIRRV